ncbi:MAG TPA: YwqG family protein [Ktedonobacterales bacterium]|nr:YwqG family protein [Ktedonobacterales bacterium]
MRDEDARLYAELEGRLRAAGLGRVLDELLALARPAISLGLTRVDEATIPIGASKVGGTADLPPAAEWPSWLGRPLPFIAQARLEEVAALDPEGDLPHRGLLSFFYAINDPDGSLHVRDGTIHWQVIYTADATTLERRPLPEALVGGLETAFPACAVAPVRRLTLPPNENELADARGFTNDERLALIGVVGGASVGFDELMDHRLLGYPYTLDSPHPFLEGYLAHNGIERPMPPGDPEQQRERYQRAMATLREAAQEWRPPIGGYQTPDDVWRAMADFQSRADMAPLRRALNDLEPTPPPLDFQARMAALERAADAEWRLLLQVYSNGEAEMDWAGGGVIHFGIARADLAARDFSRVWVNLDFL